MVAEHSQESIGIPLKLDGVIVGLVTLDDNNELDTSINASTVAYLKELILNDMLESISLTINYVEDGPILGVPDLGDPGHLRLV